MSGTEKTESCPPDEMLARFRSGDIALGEWNRIAAHCDECSACRAALEEFPTDASNPAANQPIDRTSLLPQRSVPEEIEQYEIQDEIGRGGMGVVYLARHKRLDRYFALKVLGPGFEPERLARFEREIRAVGKLQHPNIVQATDAGEHRGMPYLVMEFVQGKTLQQILLNRGALKPGEVAEIGRQAAAALAFAHENGIVHRDIKPSNLMMTAEGLVKVLDFGVASVAQDSTGPLTVSGQILGTFDYMAPEQITASTTVDHRADIYSLGATLYTLACGDSPVGTFLGENLAARIHHVASANPLPLTEVRREIPAELSQLIARMMHKDRDQRISSIADVAAALSGGASNSATAKLLEPRSVIASPSATVSEGTPPRIRRRTRLRSSAPLWIGSAVVAVVLLVSFIAMFGSRNGDPGEQPNTETAGKVQPPAKTENKPADPFPDPSTAPSDCTFQAVALSPDGKYFAAGWGDFKFPKRPTTVLLQRAEPQAKPVILHGHKSGVLAIAFSPDGNRLATGGGLWDSPNQGEILIWDISNKADPKLLHRLPGHKGGTADLTFLTNDVLVSCACGHDNLTLFDGSARVWNVKNRKQIAMLSREGEAFVAVAYAPGSRHVALATASGNVGIWKEADLIAGRDEPVRELKPNRDGWTMQLVFSSDEKSLVIATGHVDHHGQLTVWDWEANKSQEIRSKSVRITGAGFLKQGRQVAWIDMQGVLFLADRGNLEKPRKINAHTDRAGWAKCIYGLAISDLASRMVTVSWDQTARVWTLDGKLITRTELFPDN